MKRIILLLAVFSVMNHVAAQKRFRSDNAYTELLQPPGYITISEIGGGIGLGQVVSPYSQYVFDLVTIHGYQINKNYITSIGTGLSFYNEGKMLPVFADFRYIQNFHFKLGSKLKVNKGGVSMSKSLIIPYLFTKTGFLFSIFGADTDTKFFIHPGVGMNYSINQKVSVNFGAGLLAQYGNYRDSFIRFKAGISYKPGK